MFFDDKTDDSVYYELMLEIAKKQHDLLSFYFDFESGTKRKNGSDRGIWGKKRKESKVYHEKIAELEKLKEKAVRYRRERGYQQGSFWWSLPWEQVERFMLFDLGQLEDELDDDWRFENRWKVQDVGGTKVLLFNEEGHLSSFSKTESQHTYFESAYSASEIDTKLRNFNDAVTLFSIATLPTGNGAYHSSYTGIDYASTDDYVRSGEHFLMLSQLTNSYANTLYTTHERTNVSAYSNSIHYKISFHVAEYRIDAAGSLEYLGAKDYLPQYIEGDYPSDIKKYYAMKDAAVGCARLLYQLSELKKVPYELFEKDIFVSTPNFTTAMRQAELYTCLADKLVF